MTTYTDDFNRANGNLSDSPDWEDIYNSVEIDSNELNPDGGSRSYARWVGAGTWGREQEAQVEIGTLVGSTNVGPAVYMTASGGYAFRYGPDSGAAQIIALDGAGNDTVLGVGENVGSAVTGDVIKIKAEDDGSGGTLLTIYKNDISQFTRTDSTFTSGRPGVFLDAWTQSSLDNWAAEDYTASSVTEEASASSETESATAVSPVLSVIRIAEASAESESSLSVSPQIAPKLASFSIKDDDGQVVPEATGIQWWSRDERNSAPTDSTDSDGELASTDALGDIDIELANTSKTVGGTVYVECKLQDGRYGIYEATVS